ncbi:MAG: hypothetical protein IJ739_02950 [Bacteroidaceae bacterium]|nr:hypothetical protein [Bacteroidaceae bacterium]
MKQKNLFLAMFAAAALLLGMTGCSKEDNSTNDTGDVSAIEKELVGLWWDEYEYADVTEAGAPFTRVLLAVKADANHTGCIYLGAFDDTSDEPLAIYGGPEEAGFTWQVLADGTVVLSDPASGESIALAPSRTRADGDGGDGDSDDAVYGDGSYAKGMTDVSSTKVSLTGGSMTVTNGIYSGTLYKAAAGQQAEIQNALTLSAASADGTTGTYTDSKGQSRDCIVVTLKGKKYAIATANEKEHATATVNDIAYYTWEDACQHFAGGKTDGSYNVANVWRMATELEMTALSILPSRGYDKKDRSFKVIARYRTWTIGSAFLTLTCDGGYHESRGGAYHVNYYGYYWTSTPSINSPFTMYFTTYNNGSWPEMNHFDREVGLSVRLFCLLPTE